MNFYVVLALALGAISGVTETAVSPAGFAAVVRVVRVEQRAVARVAEKAQQRRGEKRETRLVASRLSVPNGAPLAGAATPRAPTTTC